MSIEKMKQWLEALEANVIGTSGRMPKTHEAIASLRQAIAEAEKPTNCRHCGGDANTICAGQCKTKEQEPVVWDASAPIVMNLHPAFEPQRQWTELTDKEIQTLAYEAVDAESAIYMAQDKLKEKNNG